LLFVKSVVAAVVVAVVVVAVDRWMEVEESDEQIYSRSIQ